MKKLKAKSTWFTRTKEDKEDEPTGTSRRHQFGDRRHPIHQNTTGHPKPESVLLAPYTPGGELRRLLQEVDNKVMGNEKYGIVKVAAS